VVLLLYTSLIAGYRRYLDVNLKYIRPAIPAAPEDILGYGFWVPWLIVAVWFAVACVLSYRLGLQRKLGYWLPLWCAFGLLILVDFYFGSSGNRVGKF